MNIQHCGLVARHLYSVHSNIFNRLTPNDPYMGRTAPLTSKSFILHIYSTNTGTEYFKNALYSPFFSLQNAVCFIMLTCLVPVLLTFYIQGVLKSKNISGAKRLKLLTVTRSSRIHTEHIVCNSTATVDTRTRHNFTLTRRLSLSFILRV